LLIQRRSVVTALTNEMNRSRLCYHLMAMTRRLKLHCSRFKSDQEHVLNRLPSFVDAKAPIDKT